MVLKRMSLGLMVLGSFFLFLQVVKALPIGPDKYYLDIEKGETITESLYLYGRQDMTSDETLYLYPVVMEKLGEEHERKFYFADPTDDSSAANWITLSQNKVTVSPGETVEVFWSITADGSAACGTNLAGIMIADNEIGRSSGDEIEEISLGSQLISQIHLTVLSNDDSPCQDLSTKFNLLEFNTDKALPIYAMGSDVGLITKIENTGNIIAREPGGYIEINGFHQNENLVLNAENYDIYPKTTRKFDNVVSDEDFPAAGNFFTKLLYEIRHMRIGKYTASLGVSKNVQPALQSSLTYWVIPWRVVATVLILITGFVVVRKTNSYINQKNN